MSNVRFAPTAGTHGHRVQRAIHERIAPRDDGAFGRYLSGVAVFGDRDGARALRLLGDASRRVRGIATVVAPLACDDAQALEALRVAWSVRGERPLLRRMRRNDRTAAIDAFLDWLSDEGHLVDLVDDLPFGSEPAVRRHLGRALDRPSRRFWEGLALAHPGVLAEVLSARWRGVAGEADPVTRQLTARHHQRIAERASDAALVLADALLSRGIEPSMQVFGELLRRRASETVDLAIRHASRVPAGALAKRVRELAPELLARIVANAPELLGAFGPRVRTMREDQRRALAEAWCEASERFPVHGAHLLRHLPDDARRRVAYERWSVAARDRDGVIAAELIAALPVELAAREAARHLREVVALEVDPVRRLAGVARHLPWDELEPALRDHLGHPEGAMRAVALTELLANPGVYPDDPSLPARALERVVARKFEQDPVRAAMFQTLAHWPRRVWRPEHLPALAQALRDALDASDLSVMTAAAMQRLIARLFGVDGAWAATWLATTIKERGALYDPNLGAKLSDDDVRTAAPHLLAIAASWATSERVGWLTGFAHGLGARMKLVAGLSALIARVRDETPYEWMAMQLTEVLARHDPEHHAATLEAVVVRYRSRRWWHAALALAELHGCTGRQRARKRARRRPVLPPPVAELVAEIARELDTRDAPRALALLRRRDPQTFDRVVAEVLDLDESAVVLQDVQRWVHRHRQDRLEPCLEERRIRGRWATGKTRWILPFDDGFFRWTPSQVERFARAHEAIVHDEQRDTPTVLAALARWPRMEWASMGRLCALASDPRPVVREKATRVLARCDAGQGVPTLLECLGDARARFAIYGLRRALFGMVGDHALALLEGAPMHKVTVAKEVVRLVGELRASGSFAWLERLSTTNLHRDVRIALLRALWDHLDRDPTWAIYERAVSDPDWVVASRLADVPADRLTATLDARLSSLLACVVERPEPEARIDLLRRAGQLALVDRDRAFLAACRRRLRSPYDDEVRAALSAMLARSAEDDMPALGKAFDALREDPRALHVAARALCAHDVRSRRSFALAARQLEAAALRDARFGVLAVEAAAARAIAGELVETLERIARSDAFDVDAAVAAQAAVTKVRDEDLEAFVDALSRSTFVVVRRVAVRALEHDARAGRGWTGPRLARLARLRADPSPAVAGAAARVWPPREDDPGFTA